MAGFKFSGFFVGSFSYNSGLQIVPEAFGGTPALADANRTNFRFDKWGFGVSRSFASWLSASAAMEIESHRDLHSHIITSGSLGCPSAVACERFGAEAPETVVNLDKFDVTVVAPIGNGLRLSLGRFDVPFGIERHDENLLLTATSSEIFRFARPQKMTGFQVAYAFAPWLDAAVWVVNRWESENTGEGDFNDNNGDKSLGGGGRAGTRREDPRRHRRRGDRGDVFLDQAAHRPELQPGVRGTGQATASSVSRSGSRGRAWRPCPSSMPA